MTTTTEVQERIYERLQIAQLQQNWGTWRDAGQWDKLATCYTPTATMLTTWYAGPAMGFIDKSRAMRARQPVDRGGHHIIGGTTSEVQGDRATAETRITLLGRASLQGTLVDVTVYGRFFDLLVQHGGAWRIQQRRPVYDKDFLQPVVPGETVALDPDVLRSLPGGFRHLAYVQSADGAQISEGIPQPFSEEEQAMYQQGQAWLEGAVL